MGAMNRRATRFIFRSYTFEPQKKLLRFLYAFEFENEKPMELAEVIHLPKVPDVSAVPEGLLERILESVHLMLGVSYYKLFCPEKVSVPYELTREQAEFWTTVYWKGLGEFAFRNKLDQRKFAKFPSKKSARAEAFSFERRNRSLLGIGGGKDSIVAGELLKSAGKDFDAFLVETGKTSPIVDNVVKVMKVKRFELGRKLDPKVLRGIRGAYNGHIPISAVFAFLGVLSGILYDYRWVIVGNEHSSNFGNVHWNGEEVNHQWSKSLEFERMFQNYVRHFVTPDITYFSLLRPFYEIRIAKMFAGMKKYHGVFSSCNRNFKINKLAGQKLSRVRGGWCGECPKCAFTFTLLSAFLPRKDVLKVFGKDLYKNESLKPLFKDLLGEGKMKPFDCVGTFEEMRAAYQVMHVHGIEQGHLFETQQASIPAEFQLIGMQNVLLLGYGKEGQATHQFLKKKFPKIKVAVADQKEGKNYLEKQAGYDLVIKTPGIPKNKVTRPYTTASNLFFAGMRERGGLIIGVTGSKGKSTTASLLAHVLKTGGKKVELLGNIGKPMLLRLLKPAVKNEITVLELSSYQLDDIEFSPHISVVTNLFPEHMTYHGNVENYYSAKCNVVSFAKPKDFFVYNPRVPALKKWQTQAQKIPYTAKVPVKEKDIPLLGEHNLDNVRAAVTVAKLLGLSDSAIVKGVKSFKGLPHRLEHIGTFKKIHFYDDAISTTPESTIMALKALKNVDTIFLGGEDRGYDFKELEKMLRRVKVRNIVLFPDTGARMLKSRKGFTILETRSMKEAVKFAYAKTKPESVCLLSCASPSYSLWTNFEEKGDEFKKFVKQLA